MCAYQPPTVYQQGAYPYPPQQQQTGWGAPRQQGPYPQQGPYQQQQYAPPSGSPYTQQQPPCQQQQQPHQQQQPPYGGYSYGPPQGQQHPPPATYMPPTAYNPAPPAHGRKKALLIGCCYPGSKAALNGCINDVQCIKYCLEKRFGFSAPGCIVVLKDDVKHPDFSSTRANIMRGIQWLMMDQRPGDSLFFHFSGHGSQQTDYSGDELDGSDETILPTDYEKAGQIVDDELNNLLVRPLQPGVTLHALMDCCHSGTVLDLPYRCKGSGGKYEWKLKSRVVKGTSGGTAFQLGACKDSQVAADTNAMSGSAYTGAATFSFIDAVEKYGTDQTYANLLTHMMESLSKQAPVGGGGGGMGGVLGALPTSLGSLAGKFGGGFTGMAAGMAAGALASFVLGANSMGGQIPVLSCDKQIDVHQQRLSM